MKFIATAALFGAAAALLPPQLVINDDDRNGRGSQAGKGPLDFVLDSMRGMTDEARKTWEEISTLYPEDMEAAVNRIFSHPKPHNRKPDSQWDYVVKGADVHQAWIANEHKSTHAESDNPLAGYSLRAKHVDPAKLGVDTVKQYSGYLDIEAEDKHFFYCEPTTIFSFPC
jgi:cathepsin A (carboxypeptidase C)